MFYKVVNTQRTSIDTQNTVTSHMVDIGKELKRLNRNVERSAMFGPSRGGRIAGGVRARESRMNPANLLSCPKTIYDLWKDIQRALGGTSLHVNSPHKSEGKTSSSTPEGKLFGTQLRICVIEACRLMLPWMKYMCNAVELALRYTR